MSKTIHTAFILAAGCGTRLAPLTNFIPKALFPIANRPALNIALGNLSRFGIRHFRINAYHHAKQIESAISSGMIVPDNSSANVIVEMPVVLGTAGGIGNLFRSAGEPDETILVHNCDVINDFDIAEVYRFHIDSDALGTLILIDNPQTNSVCFDNNIVTGFSIGNGLTYSGVGLFEPEILKTFPHNRFASLTDCLMPFIERKEIQAFIGDKFWCDFGSLPAYLELHRRILRENVLPSLNKGRNILIEQSAGIARNAKLSGFVCIGENVEIQDNCSLTNCVVWKGTTIKSGKHINSVLTPYGIIDV